MAVYKKVPGCKTVNISTLEFDTTPTPGSLNPVTSGGVAESVAQQSSNIAPDYTKKTYEANSYVMHDGVLYTNPNAIGTAEDWNPAHWTQTNVAEIVPAGTSQSNPLMNAEETERMILNLLPIEANTLRFEFSKKDYDPVVSGVGATGTWKKVNVKSRNVWDWKKTGTNFSSAFANAFTDSNNLVSIIAVGDTSTVTNMNSMFITCTSLMNVPLLNTSAVTNMTYMFRDCVNAKFGALALYKQASTQATPPSNHSMTFKNCGIESEEGLAELAQIPQSWGGLAQ